MSEAAAGKGLKGTLAIIDMQKIFGEPSSDWAAGDFDQTIAPTQQLIAAFGDSVVFTQYISPAEPKGAWVPYFQDWPFALKPASDPIWEITPALAEKAAAQAAKGLGPVVAPTFSKWGPQLAGLVKDNRLVLTGVATDCCVISTALAAADAGVEVLVVKDAVAGSDEQNNAKALEVMALYGPLIKVVSAQEIIDEAV